MRNKSNDHQVMFSVIRLKQGNPVTGFILEEDDECIRVKLTKTIEAEDGWHAKGTTLVFEKHMVGRIRDLPQTLNNIKQKT